MLRAGRVPVTTYRARIWDDWVVLWECPHRHPAVQDAIVCSQKALELYQREYTTPPGRVNDSRKLAEILATKDQADRERKLFFEYGRPEEITLEAELVEKLAPSGDYEAFSYSNRQAYEAFSADNRIYRPQLQIKGPFLDPDSGKLWGLVVRNS